MFDADQVQGCPEFSLVGPSLNGSRLHVTTAGARGCWVSRMHGFLGIGLEWPGNPSASASWPAVKTLTLGEYRLWGGGGQLWPTCYSSTCTLIDRQAMSQQSQTPLCPSLTLANPLLTPPSPHWPLQPSVTGLWDVLIGQKAVGWWGGASVALQLLNW